MLRSFIQKRRVTARTREGVGSRAERAECSFFEKNEPLPRLNPDPFKRARKGRWPANKAQGRTARPKRRRGYDVKHNDAKLNLYTRLIAGQYAIRLL